MVGLGSYSGQGPKDGTDRSSKHEQSYRNSLVFFFIQFLPLRRVQGLQCSAYGLYFICMSDAFLRRVSVLGTAK